PVPCGKTTAPRTIWSAWRGLTPRRTAMSTVSSNLALARLFTLWHASSRLTFRLRSTCSRRLRMRFELFLAIVLPSARRLPEVGDDRASHRALAGHQDWRDRGGAVRSRKSQPSTTLIPIERAVPSTDRIAD